jgi:hypothetical protein
MKRPITIEGRREQHVVDEARRRREPAALPVLGEVGAGEDADRRADQRARARHEDAPEDRVGEPAVAAGRRGHLGEERVAKRRPALPEQHADDPDEPEEPEGERDRGDSHHHGVHPPRRR